MSSKINVLVSAPADQQEAVDAIFRAVNHLNELRSISNSSQIRIVNWQKNISSGRSERAQDVINAQIQDCRAIIAVIGTRLGTSTGRHLSGTVEEIEQFLARAKSSAVSYDTHIFFNTSNIDDPLHLDPTELAKVQEFRTGLQGKGIFYNQFSNLGSLENSVRLRLQNLLAELEIEYTAEDNDAHEFEDLGSDEALTEGGRCLSEGGQHAVELSQVIESLGNEMKSHVRKLPSGTEADSVFLNDAAAIMEQHAKNIGSAAAPMHNSFREAYAYLGFGIQMMREDGIYNEDNEGAQILSSSIGNMLEAVDESIASMQSLKASVDGVPRRTGRLKRARRSLSEACQQQIQGLGNFKMDFENILLTD